VGDHVHRRPVGQRPDLTADTGSAHSAIRIVVLALLAIDGVLSAIGGALLLPSYIGVIPFPVSALISGVVNAALVWAGGRWTSSVRLAALPLWTWLLTVLAMCWPGVGITLSGRGALAYSPLLLLILGAGPPFWVLLRRQVS
jgi:hypothetical protein